MQPMASLAAVAAATAMVLLLVASPAAAAQACTVAVSSSTATHVWSDGYATNGLPKVAAYVIHQGGVFIGGSKEYRHWHNAFIVLTGGAIQCSATFKRESFQHAKIWVKKGGKLNATSCPLSRHTTSVYVVHRSERHVGSAGRGIAHIHTHTRARAHVHAHTHTRTHVHMCTHVNIHARTQR